MKQRRIITLLVVFMTDSFVSAAQYVSAKSSPEPPKVAANTTLKDCDSMWSCQDYSADIVTRRSYFAAKGCACDDLCPVFADCCPDYSHYMVTNDDDVDATTSIQHDTLPPVAITTSHQHEASSADPFRSQNESLFTTERAGNARVDTLRRYGLTKEMFSCMYETAISLVDRVWVVSRCPDTWKDKKVADLCQTFDSADWLTRLPVSGEVTLVLYRNMFCAICHKEAYKYWVPAVNCSSNEKLPFTLNTTLTDIFNNDHNCTTRFVPPASHYRLRPCFDAEIVGNCSPSFLLNTTENHEFFSRCTGSEADYSMVYSYTQAYRNQFCAFCNNLSLQDLSCQLLVIETAILVDKDLRVRFPYSFAILLDINIHKRSATVGVVYEQQTEQSDESFTCDSGQVFDPFKGVCRDVACGDSMRFLDNQCVQAEDAEAEDGGNSTWHVTRDHPRMSGLAECLPILLNATEFRISGNGVLELLDTGGFYNTSQYYVTASGTYLCVNYTQNYTRTVTKEIQAASPAFSEEEGVLSACGLGVSLLALAVTFAVYGSQRSLRNIPGCNLLSLLSALFLADALLLVAPSMEGRPIACRLVAGAMHYFFLAAFFWMNVMAVDVWFTFSQAFVRAGDRGKSSKRFRIYSAYSWLSPVIFVFPAVMIQIFNSDSPVNPRYGDGICWVASVYALLLFFVAPLLLLLIFNVVFFSISVRNIARARATTARTLGKEDNKKIGIYVRLTVVMGLTWTLGFVAAIFPHEILRYSFVVMNTLQGLFICISFVCTKKVFQLFKDKIQGKIFIITKSRSTDLTAVSKSGNSGIRGLSFSSSHLNSAGL